ncbi:TrbG/VirB9 family P-type conjugative transfer protein [Denitromonas iodatirespirans]|uniref:TrbG/VirB9 family P-type conjugative transfer protein n=1 Tax=Denitromonas iodatirespirans TaxID=2795389 RepID=A0A944DCM8_DENI1|nr:TrbG/VirB9 family P-type conjugative transfer protein [Denitromonas iodatirespirans]MBT0963012.1 TrbG/VirB9 family P-type conjugative transfer protein [Denitromonas iodatirespirans]
MKLIASMTLSVLLLASAPASAEVIPPKGDADSRVRVVAYDESDVVKLTGYVGYQTHVELAPGEKFVDLFAGDVAGLDFGQVRNNLFLKPKADLVRTNVTIVTDRRVYHFDYHVSKATANLANRRDMIYSLRFIYPKDEALAAAAQLQRQEADERFQESKDSRPQQRDYWYCGDEALRPVEAYDDGVHTYLQFSSRGEFPAIYIRNDDSSESLVNFNVTNDRLVVHRVAKRFVLRRGQLVGCVVNKGYTGGGQRLNNNVIAPAVERVTKGDIQ